MVKWQLVIASVFLSLELVLATAGQSVQAQTAPSSDTTWRPLSGAELSKLLTGMDVGAIAKKTSKPYSLLLNADGTLVGTYTSASGTNLNERTGTWRLNGDKFCFTDGTEDEFCRGIQTQGDAGPYRFADNKLPITIDAVRIVAKPGPTLPAVTVVVPGSDVPPELARFVGVWTAKWGGQYDAVIVVRRVRPDGFAELKYNFVEYVGQPFKQEKVRFGKIDGSTLSFAGVSFTLRKNDASHADGDARGTNSSGPYDFKSALSKQ